MLKNTGARSEESHSNGMTENAEILTGGYGGPPEFDTLELIPIERTENKDYSTGKSAFVGALKELKEKYPNQWVAFDRAKFLGAAETEQELLRKINPHGEAHLFRKYYVDYVFPA